jgi:mutator protein MutT
MRFYKNGEYHLVIVAIIQNSHGEILLQKRAKHKQPVPGLWESAAGSVHAGENSEEAVLREVKEEIGLDLELQSTKPLGYFYEENAIFDVWYFKKDLDINSLVLDPEEVETAKWANFETIHQHIQKDEAVLSLRMALSFISDQFKPK